MSSPVYIPENLHAFSEAISDGTSGWFGPDTILSNNRSIASRPQSVHSSSNMSIHSFNEQRTSGDGSSVLEEPPHSVSGDPGYHQQPPYGDNWPLREPTHLQGVGSRNVLPGDTPIRRPNSFAASICTGEETGFVSPVTQNYGSEASVANNAGELSIHTISPLEPIAHPAGKVRAGEQQGYARTGDGGFVFDLLQEMDGLNTGPPVLSLDSQISAPGGGSGFRSDLPMLGYNRADEGEWDPEAYKNRSLANSQTESNQSPASIRTEQVSTFTGDNGATIDENSQPRLHEQGDFGLQRNTARARRRRMPDNAYSDLGSLNRGTSYEETAGSVGRSDLSRLSSGSQDISQASTHGYGQDNTFGGYRGPAQPPKARRFAKDVPRDAQVISRSDHKGDEYPKPLQRALSPPPPKSKKSKQLWTRRWFGRKPATDSSVDKQMHDFCHGLKKKDPDNCRYCMVEDDSKDSA